MVFGCLWRNHHLWPVLAHRLAIEIMTEKDGQQFIPTHPIDWDMRIRLLRRWYEANREGWTTRNGRNWLVPDFFMSRFLDEAKKILEASPSTIAARYKATARGRMISLTAWRDE
jgi:hypothetical protein